MHQKLFWISYWVIWVIFSASAAPIQDILYHSATTIALQLYQCNLPSICWYRFPVWAGFREGRGGAGFLGLWGTVNTHFGIPCRIRCLPHKFSDCFFSFSPTLKTPLCHMKRSKACILMIKRRCPLLKKRLKKVGLSYLFLFSFFKAIKSFQAPFHAAETVWPYLSVIIENCAEVY